MATENQWLNRARLCKHESIIPGYAMLSGLVKLCFFPEYENCSGVDIFAQGRSVPISRGSPPVT